MSLFQKEHNTFVSNPYNSRNKDLKQGGQNKYIYLYRTRQKKNSLTRGIKR